MKLIRCAALVFCLLSGPALAEMSADERQDMQDTLQAALDAANAHDIELMLAAIPVEIMNQMATELAITPDQAREQMRQQFGMSGTADEVWPAPVLKFDKARYGTTPAGRDYAVFVADSILLISGVRCHIRTEGVAFQENGHWVQFYVGYPDSADLLKRAYPDFTEVSFEKMTTEPL